MFKTGARRTRSYVDRAIVCGRGCRALVVEGVDVVVEPVVEEGGPLARLLVQ